MASTAVAVDLRAANLLREIRLLLLAFVVGLVLSGLTAFPLPQELAWLENSLVSAGAARWAPALLGWIRFVHEGLAYNAEHYPFLAYGTDWLAFAHLVIAVAFWGPYREPGRNRWVVQWGMICCGLILPLALLCGTWRGIPFYWRLIDCSFGIIGAIPLWMADKRIRQLQSACSVSR